MSDEKNLQSFVVYASFLDAATGLNDEDFREYILSLKDYALFGIEHTSQNPMVNGLLTMAAANLDAAYERRKKAAKGGQFGILGGRPRKGETADEYKARKANPEGFQRALSNNPEGLQGETLNVNVNVNEKVDVDWNGNEDVNEDGNANADRNVSTNANASSDNNSVLFNPLFSSSTETGEERVSLNPPLELDLNDDPEQDTNAGEFDERMGNCVGTIADIKAALALQDQPKGLCITEERMEKIMAAERSWALAHKSDLLQEEEAYHEGAYNIIQGDMPVIRRCFEYLNRGKGERVPAAREKVHDLITGQSPETESGYITILRDLWKFYFHDRHYWDYTMAQSGVTFNPYRSM